MQLDIDTAGRHPATLQLARWFDWEHLPPGTEARTTAEFVAGPCFVRQAIDQEGGPPLGASS